MAYPNKKMKLSPQLQLGVSRNYSKNSILKWLGGLFLLLAAVGAVNAGKLIFSKHDSGNNNQAAPQVLGVETDQQANFLEYKVQKGDTIFYIGQKYNINWTTLATLNNLSSPFTLKVGQTLKIPKQ